MLHGTTISFRPDPEIFPVVDYDFDTLTAHFKEIAYLNRGLWITFDSRWHRSQRHGDTERTYYFDGGIANLVRNVNRNRASCSPFLSTMKRPWTTPWWRLRSNTTTALTKRCIPLPIASTPKREEAT